MTTRMKRFKYKIFIQDSGATLVELLASIFLLSIIVTGFLSFFIQAARTNNRIDDINEATFIAQEQLELITAYSEEKTVDEVKKIMVTPKDDFKITIDINEKDGLYAVVVIVSKEEKPLAQMETRLSFKNENSD